MSSTLFPTLQFFDDNGAVLAGGRVETFEPGTTTDKASYPTRTDADNATNPSTNPVVLDAAGRPPNEGIWLSGLTKVVVRNSANALIKTYDNVGDTSDVDVFDRHHIAGLITSNNAGDPNKSVDVAPGEARDDADSADMVLSSLLTLQIDQPPGINSIDTGAVAASTHYAVWLLSDSSGTQPTGGVFSLSFSAPTLPTNYDKKRLIGAVTTNAASNIIAYKQVESYFRYTGEIIKDVSDNTITGGVFEAGVLSVPPNSIAHVYSHMANTGETSQWVAVWVRTPGSAETATNPQEATGQIQVKTAGQAESVSGTAAVLVDGASRVEYTARQTAGSATANVWTHGFVMLTRGEPS